MIMKRLLTRWAPILAPIIIILTVLSVVALGGTVSWIPAQEGTGAPSHTSGQTFQLTRVVDFYVTNAATSTSYTLFTVPANTIIREYIARVVKREGATAVAHMTIATLTPTVDVDKATLNFNDSATSGTITSALSTVYVDTPVYLTVANALDLAQVRFVVTCEKLVKSD
jgi:hypothetical protein